jgi:hypothetical protein
VQRSSLANEHGTSTGTGTGSGSDDVLQCESDVYAQANIRIYFFRLFIVYIFYARMMVYSSMQEAFYGASVSAATACTGTLFALAHIYHRVCIIAVG